MVVAVVVDDGSVKNFSLFDFFIGASWSARDDLMLREVRRVNGILGKSSIKISSSPYLLTANRHWAGEQTTETRVRRRHVEAKLL